MDNYDELLEDLKYAIKRVNKKLEKRNETFNKYSSVYSFTTENIKGYFNESDIKNKNILTIAGSGDHIFNAMLLGAKNIECFDINKLTKYYIILKKTAISKLSYEEFIEFFIKDKKLNKKVFNVSTYSKLRNSLPTDVKVFWDIIFLIKDGYQVRNSTLFFKDVINSEIFYSNNYMNEDNYYILKKVVNNYNLKFYNCNLNDLPKLLNNKYDTIYLSNLINYLYFIFDEPLLYNFKNFITNDLNKYLNRNGKIFVAYLYSCFNIKETFYDEDSNLFNNDDFYIESIPSILFEGKDKMLIYKKN